MTPRLLLAAGLWTLTTAASAADLLVLRVNAPASVQRGGAQTPLAARQMLVAGDVISVGNRGKVALQLDGSGLITLSSLADVQLFEVKPGTGRQAAVAKLKLLGGAMRVDSRAGRGKPAQDVRLNIGSLKTRLLSADAWGANTAEGDTLCVFSGAVDVQTGSGSDERLEVPGSCLRREPDGQLNRFAVDSDPVIVGAVTATRFEGSGEVVDSLLAEAKTEAAASPVIAAAPAPAPAPMRSAPPAAVVNANTGTAWTVVVLSLSKPEPVAAHAQALVAKGLPASTRTATVNGATMHRVAVGSFATQAEARAYAAGTLAKSGIKGWPSPL